MGGLDVRRPSERCNNARKGRAASERGARARGAPVSVLTKICMP
eukprot:CAMPEP_0185295254 /NCGR_PEP_ID=MMETSP1363-20130426/8210_1 /TAXON_ID=38817 /ORGANISM="Gephyrocapsa oceanica, Strain RCC1303" /LENGTH=43 /DNA_ID= /DNA_START= /DNA_END= /DNA_ORIENTATION=